MKNYSLKLIAFSLIISLCIRSSYSQRIVVENEHLISSNIDRALVESHLVVDPNDDKHLLAAAIMQDDNLGQPGATSHIVLFNSYDGGKTWSTKHFNDGIVMGADPWLAINKKGTVLLTSLNKTNKDQYVRLLAFISPDGGKNWEEQYINLGLGHDRQSALVEPISQHFIIVSANYNSNEYGNLRHGLRVTRINSIGDLVEANWHALSNVDKNNSLPALTSNGLLLVPYVDYMVNNEMVETRRNWLIKSKDLGRTFSEPILMSENGTLPYLLIDSVKHNRLYYLSTKGQFRDYSGFKMTHSDDIGETWSEPVDITQYDGEKPYFRNASWAINNEGHICVFWYDRRNDIENKKQHIYATISTDQGKSFATPVKVTSVDSDPETEANGGTAKRFAAGGDYSGIVPLSTGNFQIVWSDSRNGIYQLYTATLTIEP